MRKNRVVRKSIKSLRSKKRRNKVNRKTKKRTQKRTQKRVKRCKNNRKTKKIKKSYELTGGMFPELFAEAAEAERQKEKRRLEEEKEKKKLKAAAKERRPAEIQEEERTAQLFGEYERIIDDLNLEQLVELLKGMKISDSRINHQFHRDAKPFGYETEEEKTERLKAMVRYDAHKLKESNRDLWNKYFGHSQELAEAEAEMEQGSPVMETSSPVMETSSPTTFQNPLAESF
jgi:hypothetical protein